MPRIVHIFHTPHHPTPDNITPPPPKMEFAGYRVNMRALFSTILQMIASLSWAISVFIYVYPQDEPAPWHGGDALQLVAALAWTVSNGLAFPDCFEAASPASASKSEHALSDMTV